MRHFLCTCFLFLDILKTASWFRISRDDITLLGGFFCTPCSFSFFPLFTCISGKYFKVQIFAKEICRPTCFDDGEDCWNAAMTCFLFTTIVARRTSAKDKSFASSSSLFSQESFCWRTLLSAFSLLRPITEFDDNDFVPLIICNSSKDGKVNNTINHITNMKGD